MEKHAVNLTEKERRKLVAIVTKGWNKDSYIQRAYILLRSDDGKTDAEISQWLYVSESSVRRTRLRFCEAGVDVALYAALVAQSQTSPTGGRPAADQRSVVNGIWYVLWTGCQWKAVHRD